MGNVRWLFPRKKKDAPQLPQEITTAAKFHTIDDSEGLPLPFDPTKLPGYKKPESPTKK